MTDWQQELRLQFLGEAQEHLDTIEAHLIGVGTHPVAGETLAALLRAAHSIKGGAAMMSLQVLSHLAHRLENCFKALPHSDLHPQLEQLLLKSVDCLREAIARYQQHLPLDPAWQEAEMTPVFDQLQAILGDPQPEPAVVISAEVEDIKQNLFETEVEACFQRLEAVLTDSEQPCIREEFLLMSQELGGLGEMLELPAWTSLCQSIEQHLEAAAPQQVAEIAEAALHQWQYSQTLILSDRAQEIPSQLDLSALEQRDHNTASQSSSNLVAISEAVPVSSQTAVLESSSGVIAPYQSYQPIRVGAEQLEQLSDLFGELTVERNGLELQLANLRQTVQFLRKKVRGLEQNQVHLQQAYRTRSSPSPTILLEDWEDDSLDLEHYDELQPLAQKVTENTVQIHEVSSDLELYLEEAERTVRELRRTSKLMQKGLAQIRMRPFSDLVGHFSRSLRDLELEYGKSVQLTVKGGSTLIDRPVFEALNEPLLHLLRNAFAHGIEDPAARKDHGKPKTGTIEMSAAYRGNRATISVRDDGCGIPFDKIRDKAYHLGFDAQILDQASNQELLNLIFEPGFTTAEQVTELAGRGVGMDVVRTKLQQVRGEISIETKARVGTTFTMTIPLSLSVLQVLLVEINGLLVAFPSNSVEEVMIHQPESILHTAGRELLNWEGSAVPLIYLWQWLQLSRLYSSSTEAAPTIDSSTVLLVARRDNLFALVVDRYWGEQEVTIRPVEGSLRMPPGFRDCTILGDGRVVPLVDVLALLRWIEQQRLPPQKTSPIYSPARQENTIMIVDDSVTVRRFLALTLEKANYRVEQAKDGQEGLEKLRSGIVIQALVCDLEMPRLDGYGFLAKLKAEPKYQHLPVVMLTSRSSKQHRQTALEMGANAYVTKPFKEQDLLQILSRLLQVDPLEQSSPA